MALSIFDVALIGLDEEGRYRAQYEIVARNPLEAEILARASAALSEIDVLGVQSIDVLDHTIGEVDISFRRVLRHGLARFRLQPVA